MSVVPSRVDASMGSSEDLAFMNRALTLAEAGLWTTTPNPRVGCVLVKAGRIVGEGWHVRAGEPHAEVHALREARDAARGATAYVTLEPCSHQGRTPPCVEALIEAGVRRVVAAMEDPNPAVSGRGFARLSSAGIAVSVGLLETEARELNIGFMSRMTRGRPWVRLKVAASLDGKTALQNGASQWITGAAAREDGHRFRARACAILTGSGTVSIDNPRLTVRGLQVTRQPLKVVIDSQLKIRPDAALFETGGVLIASRAENVAKAKALYPEGTEVIGIPRLDGRLDIGALLHTLGERGINELHVEGGASLNGALMSGGWVDEYLMYFAPCLIGDPARGLFSATPLTSLDARYALSIMSITPVGEDFRILARKKAC